MKSLVLIREVLFPPSLLNQRNAASSSLARATYAVEGLYYGMHSHFSRSHLRTWKVTANLKENASIQKFIFYNASIGHQYTKK